MFALKNKSTTQQSLDTQNYLVLQNQLEHQRIQFNLTAAKIQNHNDLILAKAQLQLAHKQLSQVKGSNTIDSLISRSKLSQAQLEKSIIYSPIDGVILKIISQPGEQMIQNKPILKMGNIENMFAIAEVYETDIKFVKVGNTAQISSQVLTEPIEGKIEHIGLMIHKSKVTDIDPYSDVNSRVVEVKIRLPKNDFVSKLSNHQVNVRIQVK
jgi:HlyD family secretion protein